MHLSSKQKPVEPFDVTVSYRNNDITYGDSSPSSDDEAFVECRSFTSSRSGIDSNSTTPRQLTPINNLIEPPLSSTHNFAAAIINKTIELTTPNTSYIVSDKTDCSGESNSVGEFNTAGDSVAFESELNRTEVENKENNNQITVESVASTIESLLEQVTSIATAVAQPRAPLAELPVEEFAKESVHSVSRSMRFDESESEKPIEPIIKETVDKTETIQPENVPLPDEIGDDFDDLALSGGALLRLSQELAQLQIESNTDNIEPNETKDLDKESELIEEEKPDSQENINQLQRQESDTKSETIPDSLETSTVTVSVIRKDSLSESDNLTVSAEEINPVPLDKPIPLRKTETFDIIEPSKEISASELPVVQEQGEEVTQNPTVIITEELQNQETDQVHGAEELVKQNTVLDSTLTDSLEMPERKGVPMDIDYEDAYLEQEFSSPKALFTDRISSFDDQVIGNDDKLADEVFDQKSTSSHSPTTFVQEINTVNIDTMFKKPALPMKKRKSDQSNAAGDVGEFQSSEGCKNNFYLFFY